MVAELASGHALSYSPLRELAADGIRDRRKYPLTDQDLAAELSTSAVTVKVEKRSASGPDTAGASGPGLAPPPGAARSIRFARAAYRPRVPPPRAAADHQGLVERCQKGGQDPDPPGRKLSLPTFVNQNTDAG